MARKKISVIGAGNVGATAALFIAQKQLGDVVMVDIIDWCPTRQEFGYGTGIAGRNVRCQVSRVQQATKRQRDLMW